MSIKQIDQATVEDGKGVEKKIDEGAHRLIYDVLQSTQYSTPIASTVRELTTNAWDSQREKEIALEILSGEKRVEDYYIKRDGAQYEASNFDKDYYNVSSLDTEMNQVELRYTKNLGTGFCDKFEVVDFGVGLGDRRLEGILSLGFSTKRNTTEGFGAFGLGAKVALSTGVPFYEVETVHNGRRFRCNCYPYKTKFTVPKFNIVAGEENPSITFSDGNVVHYEETDEKNHTVVAFGVKKHNRTAFQEAIEEQLIYIDNVILTMIDNEDEFFDDRSEVTRADIIYNSESLILSEGTVFNKPHIVIVKSPKDQAGINYGMVDFKELEMQEMYGSIGFKCPIRQSYRDDNGIEHVIHEGVSVTPSREKVIWNDDTKEYIQNVIKQATLEAATIVEEDLAEEDNFFEWVKKVRSIFSRMNNDTVLGRMSNIIDTKDVSPKFHLHPQIKYGSIRNMFRGVTIEIVKANYRGKPQRDVVNQWSDVPNLDHIYNKDGRYSPHKDVYLCQTMGYGSFLTMQRHGLTSDEESEIFKNSPDTAEDLIKKEEDYRELIWELLSGEDGLPLYSEIEVPSEIKKKLEEMEAEEEAKRPDHLSPADRRKLDQKEVGFGLRYAYDKRRSYSYSNGDEWVLDKVEPKRKELLFTEQEVYYTESTQRRELVDCGLMIAPHSPNVGQAYGGSGRHSRRDPALFRLCISPHYNRHASDVRDFPTFDTPQLVQLRQDLIKKIPDDSGLRPINELYSRRTKEDVLTMHPDIIHSYTARVVGDKWDEFSYMRYFQNVDNEIHRKYMKVVEYMAPFDYYYSDIFNEDLKNVVVDHADRLWDFQKFCMFAETEEEIAEESRRMFILSDVKGAYAVNMEVMELVEELRDYNTGVGGLLNLLDNECFKSSEGAAEVRRYLKACSRDNWSWSAE